jgi:general secretion pathway protein J
MAALTMARCPDHLCHGIRPRGLTPRGFTLIEVLVALMILSVLAATCWKGVDAITSARSVAEAHLQHTLRLQAVMTQVEADLGQAMNLAVVEPLIVDSSHVRLTRRGAGGVQVVVWFLKEGRLYRWASPVTTLVGDLQKYSLSSFQLEGKEPGSLTALEGVSSMEVFCYAGGTVANCQSTRVAGGAGNAQGAGGGPTPTSNQTQPLPEAVRFSLTMAEGSGFQGKVTREIPVELP